MNHVRPIAGAVLATLMLSPILGPLLMPAPAYAEPVRELLPGGEAPPVGEPKPESETGLAPGGGESGIRSIDNSQSDSPSTELVDAQPTLQTRHFGLHVELTCAVAGTANAIVVVNHSPELLPAGTRIKWQLRNEGKRGFFALLSPLAGGDTLVADNVLDGGADKGADCVARVI
ncbi:MAG: hypothetical protein JWQ89_372 [Devosia sp.]|uniref:hypothetical protein n=1 Tax=Devosia sp. TaxID=1871048 RepID=UPI0026376841|nr:hypothetical protein [Devosia sp.]MDB5538645.1 hypothetical protein [Devosia sp.]